MCVFYCEDFLAHFPDRKACLHYLFKAKCSQCFFCLRCGHDAFSKGRTQFHRRCKSCGYDESPLTGTLFSGIRLPIQKAFYLLYKIRTRQKAGSLLQLASWFKIQPKTVRRFRLRLLAQLREHTGMETSPVEEISFLRGVQLLTGVNNPVA